LGPFLLINKTNSTGLTVKEKPAIYVQTAINRKWSNILKQAYNKVKIGAII
jgi:hypothetical protein